MVVLLLSHWRIDFYYPRRPRYLALLLKPRNVDEQIVSPSGRYSSAALEGKIRQERNHKGTVRTDVQRPWASLEAEEKAQGLEKESLVLASCSYFFSSFEVKQIELGIAPIECALTATRS